MICSMHYCYLMVGSRVHMFNSMFAESERRFCVQAGPELMLKGELIPTPLCD